MDIEVIKLVTAALGSLGFALLFRLEKEHLFTASFGGALTRGIFLLIFNLSEENVFFAIMMAAAFCSVYAEILAKFRNTPATVLLIPSIIPLIPGSSLYYSMSNFVQGNLTEALDYFKITIQSALSIALGISIVWTVWAILFNRKRYIKRA
ncbi:MAG: threonine/serine exporter [Ruminococcaceae bacterium]|nr:threonine/serine exporter [Oscillospiraceae bacterium]